MDDPQIHSLLGSLDPYHTLLETHISWVIVGPAITYKIKKPVHLSFLDYSTLLKRKTFCGREVELNSRFSQEMYLGVSSINNSEKGLQIIDDPTSEQIDTAVEFAVRMKTMDMETQMDKLLIKGMVNAENISQLALVISKFHQNAEVVDHLDISEMVRDFNDILNYSSFFTNPQTRIINDLVNCSDRFISHNKTCILKRKTDGFIRDLHGDLHPGNVFLLDPPVLFDCIEFSDHLRIIDVFAEIGFFLMDLEYYGYSMFENIFINTYQKLIPAFRDRHDTVLLEYYKMYRANVKAKVFAIRYGETNSKNDQIKAGEYLKLASSYMKKIYNE